MKSLKEFEKERIMKMTKNSILCICPNCKQKVYPRFWQYWLWGNSGLYWCPKCLKGKAGRFWREI